MKKTKKQRDYAALALIERKGAGAGYHSKRGYSRKQKHQDDWLEEKDPEMIEEKKYIIVQTQSEGEVALTKADTFETTNNALRRYEAMDIPFVKLVEKKEWMKSPAKKKKGSSRSKKVKKTS